PWVEVRQFVDPNRALINIDIFNGVGEPILGFDQADPVQDGAPWVARDWVERDGSGLPSASRRPWLFDGDPRDVADTAATLHPPLSSDSTVRDQFGRPILSSEGETSAQVTEYAYKPLTVSVKDAERRKPSGQFSGLQAITKYDGHGRIIETSTPAGSGAAS